MEDSMDTGKKPKLGVVFFAARWFDEVVLGNEEAARRFRGFMEEDTARVRERLSSICRIVTCPLVTSMARAREAVKKLLSEDVDGVVFCFTVWSEDEYLLAFQDLIRIRPTVLWAYTPYKRAPKKTDIMKLFRNSGIVATFEAFGVLRRAGLKCFHVTGSVLDEEPLHAISAIARAAMVRSSLRETRLGILPCRNEQMIVTYVDEFDLYAKAGPSVEYLSVYQLKKSSEAVSTENLLHFISWVKENCRIDGRIDDDNLQRSARVSLGMERLMEERGIDGLALSDLNPELHEVVGLRPCLYPESLALSERVVGNEGDLGGTTAMVMLRRLTGLPVMFTEIFNYDRETNVVVAGHAGPANHLLADDSCGVTITPDYELMDSPTGLSGVWMEFVCKPGRVTLVNFISVPEGFQFTVLGGESLGGPLRIEGYPHCVIRLDRGVEDFIRSSAMHGVSHHWAIVHRDVRDEIMYLAEMLGCSCVT
jgi:L-arabinose isomerase